MMSQQHSSGGIIKLSPQSDLRVRPETRHSSARWRYVKSSSDHLGTPVLTPTRIKPIC